MACDVKGTVHSTFAVICSDRDGPIARGPAALPVRLTVGKDGVDNVPICGSRLRSRQMTAWG